MTIQKSISVNIRKSEAEGVLVSHTPNWFLKKTISGDTFILPMLVARTGNRMFMQLYIEGVLTENDGQTTIHCRIRPFYPAFFAAAVFFTAFMESLYHVMITPRNALPFFLGTLLINILFHGSIRWQEKVCLERFDKWFCHKPDVV